jgi:hypothetical protein
MFGNCSFDSATSAATALGRLPDLSNFQPAKADPREETLVRYTRGTGRFSRDKRFITLRMKMFRPDGEPDGFHEGVWEALFANPAELLSRPNRPAGPLNQPVGPVQHLQPRAETEAIWSFDDGSAIYAVGSALSHLVPLEDGSALFMVCCAQTITGGTGRYEEAYGLKTSLGSTYVPAGVNFFGPQDVQFQATTIDTFRVMRSDFVKRSAA